MSDGNKVTIDFVDSEVKETFLQWWLYEGGEGGFFGACKSKEGLLPKGHGLQSNLWNDSIYIGPQPKFDFDM